MKDPPYIETPEFRRERDEVAGAKTWSILLERNRSVILDYFFGQCKNERECSKCHKVSRTFDQFNSLSLPIPGDAIIDDDDCEKMTANFLYFPSLLEDERGKTLFEVECLEDMFLEEVTKLLREELETDDEFLFYKSTGSYDRQGELDSVD